MFPPLTPPLAETPPTTYTSRRPVLDVATGREYQTRMSRMKATARRLQLLNAAVDCFSKRGFRGTTTAQLARAAGVSEPVLYQHFPSKQALFVALLEEAGREALAEWRKSTAPLVSPMDKLRVLLRLNPATHPRLGRFYRIIFHAQAEIDDPLILRALQQHYQRYAHFLSRLIQAAQRAGQVRKDILASGFAWNLIHSGIGFAFVKPLGIPGHATPAAMEQAFALLIEQLAGTSNFPPPAPPRQETRAARRGSRPRSRASGNDQKRKHAAR
jgi:AcrR family transcriptional regulator